jgi:pSer/pThr/pTyr-binding forkhead associated (FHA) protein
MAYLVFSTSSGRELGTRRLDGPLTIGRSPECDVSLHDILLSRRHCRLERVREGWAITDLQSKNGTVIDGRPVTRHVLRPGEVIKMGRVAVTFRAGKLAPAEEKKDALVRPKRPADPFNASEGTVAGFKYEPPTGERSVDNFPTPKPVLTDSGRFVAQDEALALAREETMAAAPTAALREASAHDSSVSPTPIPRTARPKAPSPETDAAANLAQPPGLLPGPPRPPVAVRVREWVRSLQRGLRRPLARWAALIVVLAGIGLVIVLAF